MSAANLDPGIHLVDDDDGPARADQHDPAEVLAHLWHSGEHSLNWRHRPDETFRYRDHHDTPDALLAAALELDGCVWWGVNPTTRPGPGRRGGADDVTAFHVAYVDLDWDDTEGHASDELPDELTVRAVVDAFPIKPSATVGTGGGLQLYWRFRVPLTGDEFDRVQTMIRLAFEAEGLHVEGTESARVLRVPGTMNHKYDPPRPVAVADFRPRTPETMVTVETFERRYGHLVDETEQNEQNEAGDLIAMLDRAGGGPITDFNATHSIADELVASGWNRHRKFWSRPGRDQLGQSARIVETDRGEALFVYSTAPELAPLRKLGKACKGTKEKVKATNGIVMATAFDLYAVREHGGDYEAALESVKTWVPAECRVTDLNLPAEFWEARPWLRTVRQAAWSRMMSPDTVLGAVLSRYAAMIPTCYVIPAVIGAPASFDFLGVSVGQSSGGKSAGSAIGREAFPPRLEQSIVWDFPCPSGEGLVQAFREHVDEEREDGAGSRRKVKVWRVTKSAVHFIVPETKALISQQQRNGTTIASVLCSAWSGEPLGQGNATEERKRIIPAGTARVSGFMGIQHSLGHELLTDDLVEQGLTGRLVFFAADDPSMPAPDQLPDWPGEIDLPTPPTIAGVGLYAGDPLLTVADEIVDEIRAARYAVVTRQVVESTVVGHERLSRLKIAGLLALADDRRHINTDDWKLAGMIIDASRRIRKSMAEVGALRAGDENRLRGEAMGARQVAAEKHARRVRHAHIAECAAKIRDKVAGDGVVTRSELRRWARKWRDDFDDALEHAEEEGWIDQWTEPGQGDEKRLVGPPGSRTS